MHGIRYRVIIADPPWKYANWSDAKNGAASSAYQTMDAVGIRDIPVAEKFAADDCVMLLWATWPKAREAMELLGYWGFNYVTGFPWIKTVPSTGNISTGVGFWTQGTSEMVLIGRRGKPKLRKGRKRRKGLICGSEHQFYAPKQSQHSRKPDDLHEYAEDSLRGPYLELFARRMRSGWTCLGNELGWQLDHRGATRIKDHEPATMFGDVKGGR